MSFRIWYQNNSVFVEAMDCIDIYVGNSIHVKMSFIFNTTATLFPWGRVSVDMWWQLILRKEEFHLGHKKQLGFCRGEFLTIDGDESILLRISFGLLLPAGCQDLFTRLCCFAYITSRSYDGFILFFHVTFNIWRLATFTFKLLRINSVKTTMNL